jgi:hypothetical protein
MTRSWSLAAALIAAVLLSSCAYDWDQFDPRRADAAQQSDATQQPDSAACGATGLPCCVSSSCATGLLCAMGLCQPCPSGQLACNGACVDTSANDAHCGRCNNACRGNTNCINSTCR